MASALDISLSKTNAPIITEAAMAKTRSFLTVCFITLIGATIAATPTMSISLNTLLPTTVPTAISAVPLSADTKLTQNSGIDVPRATTVRPITIWGTPSFEAIPTEPSVSRSAPQSTTATPTIIRRISITISIIF